MLLEAKILNFAKWFPPFFLVVTHLIEIGILLNIILLVVMIIWMKKKEKTSSVKNFSKKIIGYNLTNFIITFAFILNFLFKISLFKNLALFFLIYFQLSKNYS